MTPEPRDTVAVESIPTAPIEKPTTEPTPPNQDPLTGRNVRFDQELGKVGAFIGGKSEKAGNIAYVVVISSLVILVLAGMAITFTANEKAVEAYNNVITGAISLVTGALGYLFGSGKSKK